jgi:hypothetical protein
MLALVRVRGDPAHGTHFVIITQMSEDVRRGVPTPTSESGVAALPRFIVDNETDRRVSVGQQGVSTDMCPMERVPSRGRMAFGWDEPLGASRSARASVLFCSCSASTAHMPTCPPALLSPASSLTPTRA